MNHHHHHHDIPEGNDPVATMDIAESLFEAGDFGCALDALKSIPAAELDNMARARALSLQVACLFHDERADEANQVLQQGLETGTPDEEFLFATCTHLTELDAGDLAEDVLRSMIEKNPSDARPMLVLGILLASSGASEEALEIFETALKAAPDHPEILRAKAQTLEELDRLEDAATCYRQYLTTQPTDYEEWLNLARVESKMGHFAKANDSFLRVEKLNSESTNLYGVWLVSSAAEQNIERMEYCIAKLEELSPNNWRVLFGQALVASHNDEKWRAWELVQQATDRAATQGDLEEFNEAVATALMLADQLDVSEQALTFAWEMVRMGAASEPILSKIRTMTGNISPKARGYVVDVEGQLTDEEIIEEICRREEAEPPFRYSRMYLIIAESPEEAERVAIETDRMMDIGSDQLVASTVLDEQMGISEDFLGVAHISDIAAYLGQGDDQDDDE